MSWSDERDFPSLNCLYAGQYKMCDWLSMHFSHESHLHMSALNLGSFKKFSLQLNILDLNRKWILQSYMVISVKYFFSSKLSFFIISSFEDFWSIFDNKHSFCVFVSLLKIHFHSFRNRMDYAGKYTKECILVSRPGQWVWTCKIPPPPKKKNHPIPLDWYQQLITAFYYY